MTRSLQEIMDSATTLAELNALSTTDEFAAAVEQSMESFQPTEEERAIARLRAAAHRAAQ